MVEIVEREEVDLSNALLVAGFSGATLAGPVAGTYLWDTLGLRYVASVEAREFTLGAVVSKGQPMALVRIGLGDAVCGMEGDCDQLAVVVSEVPLRGSEILPTAHAILGWAKEREVKEVLVLDALRRENAQPSDTVWGVCNSSKGKACLKEVGVSRFTEGVISGMTGVFLYKASDYGLDVMSLLIESPGEPTDARAAARLVESMAPLVPRLKIDPGPLFAQAQVLEEMLRKNAEAQAQQAGLIRDQANKMFG
jgi:uncharacterized protein